MAVPVLLPFLCPAPDAVEQAPPSADDTIPPEPCPDTEPGFPLEEDWDEDAPCP